MPSENHLKLQEIARDKLIEEGFKPDKISFEHRFQMPTGKEFILDVVARKNGDIHTVVECGSVSPSKIAILKTYFPKVIHMPYFDYFDVKDELKKVNKEKQELIEKTNELRAEIREMRKLKKIDLFNDRDLLDRMSFTQILDVIWSYIDYNHLSFYAKVEKEGKSSILKTNTVDLGEHVDDSKYVRLLIDRKLDDKDKHLNLFETIRRKRLER